MIKISINNYENENYLATLDKYEIEDERNLSKVIQAFYQVHNSLSNPFVDETNSKFAYDTLIN